MSGATETSSEWRLVKVTAGNLRNHHLHLTSLRDFLPNGSPGPRTKRNVNGATQFEIELAGLNETIRTDIGSSHEGRPRTLLQERGWIRRFFEHHRIHAGDSLKMERLADRKYRLAPCANAHESTPLRAAEFFAGIGLVRLALEQSGWDVVFANDIDEAKATMYRDNWPDTSHLHVGDIHSLEADNIPDCDLFTASFPCNDLSIAGRMEGLRGKESSAFWGLIRILRDSGERRPRHVLLENVVGFLQSNGGDDLTTALLALNEFGYAVDAFILNASRWTPQSRARLFIHAQLVASAPPPSLGLESEIRPAALCRFIHSHPEIHWSCRRHPIPPQLDVCLADIIEDLPDDDPHWWNQKRLDYFMGQLSENHAEKAAAMIMARRVSFATAFRRVRYGRSMAELRTDGIAGCLRTPRGGSGRQILFKAGHGKAQVRLLTARECARLQGTPDSYAINVPLNQALFGFGDAVCVPAVKWILTNVVHGAVTQKIR